MRVSCLTSIMIVTLGLAACNGGSDTTPRPDSSAADDRNSSASEVETAAVAMEEVVDNESCGINAPQPGGVFPKSAKFPVWGYAFDRSSGSLPADVSVRMTAMSSGKAAVFKAARGNRPDVVEKLGKPELLESGFGVEIDVTGFEPGQYIVSVLQVVDGKYLVCNNPLPITLK